LTVTQIGEFASVDEAKEWAENAIAPNF